MRHLNSNPFRRGAARSKLALLLCATPLGLAAFGGGDDATQDDDTAWIPPAVLNEILFDSLGTDGTADTGEYVEIIVLQDQLDLSTLKLTDNLGNALGTFPQVLAPKGCAVVLNLGPGSLPYLDSDPADGSAGFSSGLPRADYLGNTNGGVRLVDAGSSQVIDAFYWGRGSAPVGTQIGPWGSGQFFDTSLATGDPVAEGESVGRHAYETNYPGSPGDWTSHGGPVAAHPSAGRSNDLMHASPEDLLLGAQQLVNDTLLGYGDMQYDYGRYSITDSSATNVVVSRPASTTLLVTADHSFTIAKHGVPSVFKGELLTELVGNPDADSLSYERNVKGTLTSASGDSIFIDNRTTYSGFSIGLPRTDYESHASLVESSVTQWFEISGHQTLTQQSDDQWLFAEKRECRDYLDPSTRTIVTSNVVTRVGDGMTHSFFTMNRPFPSGPTPFTGTPYDETLVMELDSHALGNGSTSVQITRYDESRNGQLEIALQKDQIGSMDLSIGAFGGQYAVDFDMNLPVEEKSTGQTATASAFMNRVDSLVGGKYVATGVRGYRRNGATIAQNNFHVDPPVYAPQGSGNTVTLIIIVVDQNGTVVGVIEVEVEVTPPPPPPPPPPAPPAPPRKTPGETAWEAGEYIASCALGGATVGSAFPLVGNLAGALIGAPACGIVYGVKRMIFG